MSAAAVSPFDSISSCALASAASYCAASGAGTLALTSSIAASTNKPFSIVPPEGALVCAVIPAALSAALLATAAWPSTRSSHTGRSPTTASRSAAVGKRLSAHNSWFQPRPDTQPDPGLAAA